jgi:hypothetical protein
MRNFKSAGGKSCQLVDGGDRTAANLKECMPAKQASALVAIFFTIGYQKNISYYRFIMGEE